MLEFNMRYKCYELRACPRHLARLSADDTNETVNFVKRYEYNGTELVYSIGYFWWNEHESCWELHFVGDRFCEVASEDIKPVWAMLKSAYEVLTEWKREEDDDKI